MSPQNQISTPHEVLVRRVSSATENEENYGLSPHFPLKIEIQGFIDWLMNQLKHFLSDVHVEVRKFKEMRSELANDLSDLKGLVFSIRPYEFDLIYQMQFVEKVFETLVEFVSTFGEQPQSYDAATSLVYRMAEIGVVVYKLYDTKGDLDTSVADNIEKLQLLWDLVVMYRNKFEVLSNVNSGTRMQFHRRRIMTESAFMESWIYLDQ